MAKKKNEIEMRRVEERADALLAARIEQEEEMKEINEKRRKVLDMIIYDAPSLNDNHMLKNAISAYYVHLMEDIGFVPHKS